MTHRIRLFAAAAAAAGTEETSSAAASIAELREELSTRFGREFAGVLAQCSLLVDGVRTDSGALAEGAQVDVLPPFAGG
ncbi:MoaD/ThiS family protein [Gulosibacter macacae]|uniref:MoaD/ThiS family protein n=1 Tax=Gulosibacter macacae TaxID=2488791 RepID=A0A3P3VVM9_9MICO|nr:MoaD/ThiS family protein [Gulosibacter macacae]RRJ86855.1 MoaD/ThiS family protein [Gulosibacter macacae]